MISTIDSMYYTDPKILQRAVVIGKTMPNLCYLRLSEYFRMGDKGLEAIADGCPNFESLDLVGYCGFDKKKRALSNDVMIK